MTEVAARSGFSWNLVSDWQQLTGQEFMRHALIAGTITAVICGLVGYFVVLRGLVFASDALTHIGFSGAAGAVLLGFSPVVGLIAVTTTAAVGIGAAQERLRGRDVVVGMTLVLALGLGLLFLRLHNGYSNQTYALLFGDLLVLSLRDLLVLGGCAAGALAGLALIYRPLLFASIDDEVAAARGVPVRALGAGFVVILALAVVAATQVVGALLAVALIVAPGAAAHRMVTRPGRALLVAVLTALGITWGGIAVAYWQPYPVSFFITMLAALLFAASRMLPAPGGRRGEAPA